MTDTKTKFPKAAATIDLEKKILSKKTKGDRITAREVLDATGMPIDRMRRQIKAWATKSNLVVKPVPGDGYRILLDAEHIDESVDRTRRARNQERRALHAVLTADASKLDQAQARRHEFVTSRIAARVARIEQDIQEIKREFKLTERVPLRVLTAAKG